MGAIAPLDYGVVYRTAVQANWRVDDIVARDAVLSFDKPFLPDAWVDAEGLGFLSAAERLVLNHIRAHSYAGMIGLVEEYIVPFLVGHIGDRMHDALPDEMCALLHFAEEESKHIELFRRFNQAFRGGFGSACDVIGPPKLIAEQILRLSPLGVALSILHLEWLTQLHYVATVRDNSTLDARFSSLLRHHWIEEAQHTKLDTAVVGLIAEGLPPHEIAKGVDDYLLIVNVLDEGFGPQVTFDLSAFTAATGRQLAVGEQERYRSRQRQSYRKTFLTAGMRHPRFQQTLAAISADATATVTQLADVLESGRPSALEAVEPSSRRRPQGSPVRPSAPGGG